MLCEPPRDAGSLKAIRGSLPVSHARAVLCCSPRKQSFFSFSFKNKKEIYIYIYFFMWSCARTSLDGHSLWISPQPQAEDQGVSPTGWDSVGGLPRDPGTGVGNRLVGFPLWGGPRQGELAPLQAAFSGLEASTRWPNPGPETPPLSLWGQKPQGKGLWGPHRTQALGEVPGWASRGKRKGHSCLPVIIL